MDAATLFDAETLIRLALAEDLADGVDCTSEALVDANEEGAGELLSRGAGVICGIELTQLILRHFPGVRWTPEVSDGQTVDSGNRLATLQGNSRQLLRAERTILNFMGRLSGVATLTRLFAKQTEGTRARVVDTRKTTPGWRRLEKHAVLCGGGVNHRLGLYDGVLIKDNHLAQLRQSFSDEQQVIRQAVGRARQWINAQQSRLPHGIRTVVQLEIDQVEQLEFALQSQPDMILLDNMTCEQLAQAVAIRDRLSAHILLEASGGVRLDTIRAIAETGVERISIGALTHSAVNFDIGLDWVAQTPRS
jgi:nicotinate-nucleotide pyrophosphorylase (carboxylating)